MISGSDIRGLCGALNYFDNKADWRFKGRAVVNWEFVYRAQFERRKSTDFECP